MATGGASAREPHAVRDLLAADDPIGLELLAEKLRSSRSRAADGTWELADFYATIGATFSAQQGNRQFWIKKQAMVDHWLWAYPHSPTAHLVNATMQLRHAWNLRGGGITDRDAGRHTDRVSPDKLAVFHSYVEATKIYLLSHKQPASSDPHWYVLMGMIAHAQRWPVSDVEALFAEAVAREPLYSDTYFTVVDYYGQGPDGKTAIELFARRAIPFTRASEGNGMYARIYWYASRQIFARNIFSDSRVDWNLMKQGIDDVLAKYPDNSNVNHFAKLACQAKDRDKSAALLKQMKGLPLREVWTDVTFFRQCAAWSLKAQ